MCAFLRAVSKTKKRYQNQTKTEPQKQRKTNTRATHQNIQKRIKKSPTIRPKWLPGGGFGGSGSLLAAGSAPRASQNRLRRPPGPRKNLWTRPGATQDNFPAISCPPQNRHPPPYGGVPRRSAPRKIAFLLKILAPASAGCKNRGSWFLGGHSREELKLLSTTSKLVV